MVKSISCYNGWCKKIIICTEEGIGEQYLEKITDLRPDDSAIKKIHRQIMKMSCKEVEKENSLSSNSYLTAGIHTKQRAPVEHAEDPNSTRRTDQ
jgi:hypothetical protein